MAKKTAQVRHQQLFCFPNQEPLCSLDSPAWFLWLDTARSFRYFSDQRQNVFGGFGPLYAPVSLRKERRRHSWHWYAYRRTYRVLHKRYVGASDSLSMARLDDVAILLNEVD